MHNVITGHSASGILYFLNQTPLEWFSKCQEQVETMTYGSKFMAAQQAIEQIIDLRYTLCMFGIPLDGASWLFGDNKPIVTSLTTPHSLLGKCWNALSYHCCCKAVVTGIVISIILLEMKTPATYSPNLSHTIRQESILNPYCFGKVKPTQILATKPQKTLYS